MRPLARLVALSCALLSPGVLADSPLTSTDLHTAYHDVPGVRRALQGPPDATYAFLASNAPNDQKLAAANALGWKEDFATGFLLHLARKRDVPDATLAAAALTPSQRFVAGYLVALATYGELGPLRPGGQGVWAQPPQALLDDAAAALPDDFAVQYARALVQAQAAMDSSWCDVFRIPDAVVRRFPPKARNLRPGALEAARGYLSAYEASCEGSTAAQRVKREALNQVYTLSKRGPHVVAGTQGGVVVWSPDSPVPVATRDGFICKGVAARDAVWVGCEADVARWDGKAFTAFLPRKEKGSGEYYEPFLGPDGEVLVRLGQQAWRWDEKAARFTPTSAPWGAAYDVVYFQGRAYWVEFLQALHAGDKVFPRGSAAYPGSDPRRLRVDAAGRLWVEDFESGLFRFEGDRFVRQPGLDSKASGVAFDAARGHLWLLHYTQGLTLVRDGKATQRIDLADLEYLRDLLVDEATGDVWVAGWNQVLRLRADGPQWARQRFRVK